MEHDMLVALRDALDLAIERSEENVLRHRDPERRT
jgi:hypothetical protein